MVLNQGIFHASLVAVSRETLPLPPVLDGPEESFSRFAVVNCLSGHLHR